MSEKAQNLLCKSYAPAVESRLSRFPSRDQLPIASWLIRTPVGTNYALQIIECLEDLAKKEDQPASTILTQVLLPLINDDLQPKEMGREVRDILYKRLHPISGDHFEKFHVFSKGLKLPLGVQLHPPQNFEGSQFKLEVVFENSEDLKQHLQEILSSLENSDWEKLKDF